MYNAKITAAKEAFSLPDNAAYMDIWFDILLDGEKVADRRLAFPMGTSEKAIKDELRAYCRMYENDHLLAAEAQARSEKKAESEKTLNKLIGKTI